MTARSVARGGDQDNSSGATYRPPRTLVATIACGTLLNPLNSSMIAVAIVSLQHAFGVGTATASWLISGFYLAASVGMPLMGRLADAFGARRVFCGGLVIVGITGALAPFSPSLPILVLFRVLQAFGTSAAYPSGLAILRAGDRHGRPPAAALGAMSIAGSVSAALGPVIGGFLVAFAGWHAIFLINIPVAVAGIVLALRFLPADPPRTGGSFRETASAIGSIDLPGILLFSGTLVALLGFLLSLASGALLFLLPVAAGTAIGLYVYEGRAATPFIDIAMLAANRRLVAVFLQYAAVNVVFYGFFFGLPIWLERVRHFGPETAGLLLLPIAGTGIVVTPIAARMIRVQGTWPALVIGSCALLVGSLLLLIFGGATPLAVIVVVGIFLGLPNGFNNLGLQAALYRHAPPEQMGAAAGQFQTFRYLGAISSTALIGLVFGWSAGSNGIHIVAAVLAVVSLGLVVASLLAPRTS